MNFQPDNMKSTWMSWVPSWTINLLEMTKLEWGKSNLIQPNMDGTIIKISNQVAQNTRFISWPFHTSELDSTRKLTDRPNRLHNDQSSMAMCGLLETNGALLPLYTNKLNVVRHSLDEYVAVYKSLNRLEFTVLTRLRIGQTKITQAVMSLSISRNHDKQTAMYTSSRWSR